MQDVTTGLPNGEKLIADIQKIITARKESRNMQAILIDIKDFRSINKRHGFLKGDEILRRVAQSIQKSIRRNEDMYMAPLEQELWENVYRRYPGGDEFIFLIEGDQAAAVGFVVNRLLPSFKELTDIMPQPQLLGHKFNLSFDCAIVNAPPGVSPTTVFKNIGKCYARATQGKKDFNICWTPQNLEDKLDETDYRRAFYRKAYSIFDVMSIDENELSNIQYFFNKILR